MRNELRSLVELLQSQPSLRAQVSPPDHNLSENSKGCGGGWWGRASCSGLTGAAVPTVWSALCLRSPGVAPQLTQGHIPVKTWAALVEVCLFVVFVGDEYR